MGRLTDQLLQRCQLHYGIPAEILGKLLVAEARPGFASHAQRMPEVPPEQLGRYQGPAQKRFR